MYWKYNSPSAEIEALLQKEDVSLSELMAEDELLQECKIPNKKVIDFLTKCDVIEELVLMIVSDPSDTVDVGLRFKNANLAAELLTCDALVEKLVASSNLVQHLYKFFHNEKPLNPILASFVSKVFATPLQRRSEQNWYSYQFNCFQVLEFIKSKDDFVDIMVNHVGTSAVMVFISQLISGIEEDDQEIKRSIHTWLDDSCLVDKLVDKLSPESDSEEHSSIESILCEIAFNRPREPNCNSNGSSNFPRPNILSRTLQSERVINKMLDILLKENWSPSSVRHVITILVTLFASENNMILNIDQICSTTSIPTETPYEKDNTVVVTTIIQRMFELQNMLLRPSWPETIPTAFGSQIERLSSTKFQVVTLISALICTNYDKVHQEMAALSTLPLLLTMFYQFSLNNFLHTRVTQAITSILINPVKEMKVANSTMSDYASMMESHSAEETFQVPTLQEMCKNVSKELEEEEPERTTEMEPVAIIPSHPLLEQLFTKCQIVQRLLADLCPPESNEVEKKNHNMKGYMGHLRIIANTINSCSKDGSNAYLINKYIKELPNGLHSEWEDFALITLAELNLKNEVIPVKITSKNAYDSDSDDEFYICNQPDTVIIVNQDFKGSDMETSSFRDADTFRTVGESMSDDNVDFDDASNWNNNALFEKMCSEKNIELDDLWKFQEKEIKFPDMIVKDVDDDETHDSSSDEEDDRFANLKSCDNKIDTDDEDWSKVFDKRDDSGLAAVVDDCSSEFNPWHSASACDTDGSSWANFENAHQSVASAGGGVEAGKNSPIFYSLAKEDASNAMEAGEETEAENVPPTVFEVDFHTPFSTQKSPFSESDDVSIEEVCDSKLSSDNCMQNRQDSSNTTSNIEM